ncbi:hemerythrin domain-containing protein [Cohnella cholangitidis]|uniref:Hemerythrin domain-containing protein n=2 Tax=Cohnella cholangitidis TaxID=2598458 RepID=A0A7G5C7M9_9BACL|nr:hemerythrin domain-containing protein [Cohnella cholangitidis]
MYGCGGQRAESIDASLCAPLQRLMREHIPLWDDLEEFLLTAERVEAEAGVNQEEALTRLYEQVSSFAARLKVHARKEDDVLFPMMARYIGRETGPISVMEYEHSQAEYYLDKFLEEASGDRRGINANAAKVVAGYAIEAYSILTTHFSKEENVLFPMAESMLSDEEKARLDSMMLQME